MKIARSFWLRWFVLLLGAVSLQGGFLAPLFPSWLTPQLLVILTVGLAFFEPTVRGACAAFLAGVVLDLMSGTVVGPWAAGTTAVFGILASLRHHIFLQAGVAAVVAVSGGVIAATLVHLAVGVRLAEVSLASIATLAGEAVVSGVISPYVMRFFTWWLRLRSTTQRGRGLL